MDFLYNNFLTDLFCMGIDGLAFLVSEYAVAIILMTIFIRLALMPVDIKMRSNQQKMADLKPQLESIQKRYANNPQQLQKKQSELYKKMGAQPIFGCLPMVLQLFILFAFFGAMRALQSEQTVAYFLEAMEYGTAHIDIHSFFWVHNLWQPDTTFAQIMPTLDDFATFIQTNSTYISPQVLSMLETHNLIDFSQDTVHIVEPIYSSVRNSAMAQQGFLSVNGNPLANGVYILPILSGVSLFISQKFGGQMGQEMDPAMGGSNKMMMYIFPAFSVYICITSNAAFALYWTVSSLYAFLQGRVIIKALQARKAKKESKKKAVTITNG